MGTWETPQEILKAQCDIKEGKLVGLKLADKGERGVITYSEILTFV